MDPFDELVAEVRPRLARAFAAAYGVERGQEALAEALAWAWEHRDRVLSLENPGGYLFRVGQSRSRPSRRRLRGAAFPAPRSLGIPDIEPGLASAFGALSERQRVCIALVVVDEWSHEEAAELLGLKKSTVQSHVERALRKLRAAMGVSEHADC